MEILEDILVMKRGANGEWVIASQQHRLKIAPPPPASLPTIPATWKRPSMIHGSSLPNVPAPFARLKAQGVVMIQGKGDHAQANYSDQDALLSAADEPLIRCEMMSAGYAYTSLGLGGYYPARGLSVNAFDPWELQQEQYGRAKIDFWVYPSAIDKLVRGITARLDAAKERGAQAVMLDNTSHPSARPERPWDRTLELLTRCRDAAHDRGLLLFTNMAAHFASVNLSVDHVTQLAKAVDLVSLEQWWNAAGGAYTFRKYQRPVAVGCHLAFIPQVAQPSVAQPVSWRDEARFSAGIAHCLGNTLTWCYINRQESWDWYTGEPVAPAVLTDAGVRRKFANGEVTVNFANRTASFIGRSETGDG